MAKKTTKPKDKKGKKTTKKSGPGKRVRKENTSFSQKRATRAKTKTSTKDPKTKKKPDPVSNIELHNKLKHEDFPEFIRAGFEAQGLKVGEKSKGKKIVY